MKNSVLLEGKIESYDDYEKILFKAGAEAFGKKNQRERFNKKVHNDFNGKRLKAKARERLRRKLQEKREAKSDD